MHELFDGVPGDRLHRDDYQQAFDRDFWKTGAPGFWKLERGQTFQEPSSPSWVAFAAGDWDEARRLTDARRPELEGYYRKITDHGFRTHRVRVVQLPLTPYLRWELHLLRLRDELGGTVRVVDAGLVRVFETAEHHLPEICTLSDDVMYQAVYDENGLQQGGIRYTDRELIRGCRVFIEELFALGEDLPGFLEREVAPLE